jgi:autotransporter-associated beta strand protein
MNNPNPNGRTLPRSIKSKSSSWLLPTLLLSFSLQSIHAGSATWSLNPTDDFWFTPTNWTPNTVPNGTNDTATFDVSNVTNITANSYTVSEMIFNPGASAYTFLPIACCFPSWKFAGPGITNNSGVLQKFVVSGSDDEGVVTHIDFLNSSSAGALTQFTVSAATRSHVLAPAINFFGTSSAGSGTFIITPPAKGNFERGLILFEAGSTAGDATFSNSGFMLFNGASLGNATIVSEGATVAGGLGGWLQPGGSMGTSTCIANGTSVAGGHGAQIQIFGEASADNATLIANGGTVEGGQIIFTTGTGTGGTCRVEVFGSGKLDIGGRDAPGLTIGSLEGDGLVYLGANILTIGSSNLSTTFSGLIQDGGIFGTMGGGLAKTGKGMLILTGANLYPGNTTITDGALVVTNTTGSGTGTGAVQVERGLLGGSGIMAGPVTVGTGSGGRARIAPAATRNQVANLTTLSALTCRSNATYICAMRNGGGGPAADRLNANGVTIDNGATFVLRARLPRPLQIGTVFIVIGNTAATPISGTFSNLADGAIVSVNGTNLQANYSGGDGNDLTLTVVP